MKSMLVYSVPVNKDMIHRKGLHHSEPSSAKRLQFLMEVAWNEDVLREKRVLQALEIFFEPLLG